MLRLARLAVAALALSSLASIAPLERGDAAWSRRADGSVRERAEPAIVAEAIAGYEAAIVAAPRSLEPRWKLLRALWFAGDFASADPDAGRASYERALEQSELAFDTLAERVGGRAVLDEATPESLAARLAPSDRRDAAALYFWSAVNLGAWARLAGLLQAVRAGAANELRVRTERSVALDPGLEGGGAIRLLSRLHSMLPRVPLLSPWVDHAQALPLAERAAAQYPEHPGNAYLLGLTLLDHAPQRRAEAITLLERTAALEPRADHVIEDRAIAAGARERLEAERR
jgi:hypothetical protein